METVFTPYLFIPMMLESFGISEKKFKATRKRSDTSWMSYPYALPYLALWGLAVYGLMAFSYGRFGSKLPHGNIISFWLVYHIINLTFVTFYVPGRSIYHSSERSTVDEVMVIEVDDDSYQVRACDISETRISFHTDLPSYLPREKELMLNLQSRGYHARVKDHIVRVFTIDNGWRYGVQFSEVPEADKCEFYQYIYDCINHDSPREKGPQMTTWSDLFENLNQRFQSNEHPVLAYGQVAFPKVRVNKEVRVAGKRRQLRKTDYYYMIFSGELTSPKKEPNVTFTYKDLPIQLTLVPYDIGRDESLCQVTNLTDLDSLPASRALANEWKGRI